MPVFEACILTRWVALSMCMEWLSLPCLTSFALESVVRNKTWTPACFHLFGYLCLLNIVTVFCIEVCLEGVSPKAPLTVINVHIKYLALECHWILLARRKIWNVKTDWHFLTVRYFKYPGEASMKWENCTWEELAKCLTRWLWTICHKRRRLRKITVCCCFVYQLLT